MMTYPEEFVQPMKAELTVNGFTELLTSEDVNNTLNEEGTTLVFINSVCGCAAGSARPAVLLAMANAKKKPDRMTTSFAGFDHEGVKEVRNHLLPYPPSSPSIALFKDGKLAQLIERHQIEGKPAQVVAQEIIDMCDEFC